MDKWDRRDLKRQKKKKMKVSGASTKVLWGIIVEKSKKASKRDVS